MMTDETLTGSLKLLCGLLHKHYGRKVILLIDEYDVPLDKAQHYGYYDEMVTLIRNLFAQALKTNDHLQFAVLTGCLRVAKGSGSMRPPTAWPSRPWGFATLDTFCAVFPEGDAQTVERQFGAYLRRIISIRDTGVRKERKENFYHGILLGLLRHRDDWILYSNAESGDGYSDILVEDPEVGIGIVIELKYREDGKLEEGCREALEQIEDLDYAARLEDDGIETVVRYGIACNRKKCRVIKGL